MIGAVYLPAATTACTLPLPHEHLITLLARLLPLLQKHANLGPDIFHDEIRLDIGPIVPKRIFQLTRNCIDAVKREHDQHDDGDGPIIYLVDEGKG